MEEAQGALAGVRVVDASRILAGPYAAMLLGDLGASVIKVEQPGSGDDTRSWGPPFAGDGASAYYLAVNRSKRGVAVDLGAAEGRAVLDDLLSRADVLIENFKPRSREAFSLTAEKTAQKFPRLVHAAISGYGATGEHAERPGYDNVVQAASGLMSITGPVEGPGYKVGVAVSDLAAGLHAAVAILAALKHRDRTGFGQFIDVSLFDASLSLLANVASSALISGETPRRWGNAHPSIVPYQVFAASDRPLMVAVGNDRQFRALCDLLGLSELADDPRFATNPDRVRHREALVGLVAARFRQRPAAGWLSALEKAGVPAAPIRSVPEALASPETTARDSIIELIPAGGAAFRAVGPVPRLSATPARAEAPPGRIGEHTDAVLRDWLGYDAKHLADLRARGVIA